MDIREQWEADIAGYFARQPLPTAVAIMQAERVIARIKAGVRWSQAVKVKAERNRWDDQRRTGER